jgi:hypothetical protein
LAVEYGPSLHYQMNITCSERHASNKNKNTLALSKQNLTNSSLDEHYFHIYKTNMEHSN